MVPCELVAI